MMMMSMTMMMSTMNTMGTNDTLKEKRFENELMMPMKKMRSSEGRLKAADGLGKISAVQIPETLNEFDQSRGHGENQRKLT